MRGCFRRHFGGWKILGFLSVLWLWIWIKIGSVFSIFMDLYLYTEYGSGTTGKQLKIAPHKLKAKGLKFKKIVFLKKKLKFFSLQNWWQSLIRIQSGPTFRIRIQIQCIWWLDPRHQKEFLSTYGYTVCYAVIFFSQAGGQEAAERAAQWDAGPRPRLDGGSRPGLCGRGLPSVGVPSLVWAWPV